MKINTQSVLATLLSGIAILIAACTSEPKDAWSDFLPLNKVDTYISGYYDASIGQDAKTKSGKPAIYVDFSDGLVQAYANANNANMIDALAQKLVDQNNTADWYGLGKKEFGGIGKLNFADARDLYNKVKEPTNYKDIMAPIEEALKQITNSKNDAILITDFEEYTPDGKEQQFSYAKTYFTNWLKAGNSITFHYNAYTENNKKTKLSTQKNLYFVLFTYGLPDGNSLITKFNAAISGRNLTNKTFEINSSPYTVSNDYGGKDVSGFKNKILIQGTNLYHNGWQEYKKPYEIIGIKLPFTKEKLDKYIQEEIIKNENSIFLDGLILNAENQQAYRLTKVGVKVYDVSDDYEYYARSQEVKDIKPVLIANEKKEQVWDDKSEKNAKIQECFNLNTLVVKENYIYNSESGKSKIKLWEEVFDFDKDIFEGHLKNDPGKIVLKTKLHNNFKLQNIKNEVALIRIDFVIDEANGNVSNQQLDDFKWKSVINTENGENSSLYESIRSVLQDVKPEGILYSYYIKFGNITSEN